MSVERLVLWNADWGRAEGTEHEKLLFNYVRDQGGGGDSGDADHEQHPGLKQASLAEGVCQFVNLFASDGCEGKNDSDPLAALLHLIASLETPVSIEGSATIIHLKRIELPNYWMLISSNANTSQAKQLIEHIYDTFFLLNGSLEQICQSKGKDALKTALNLFFEWFMSPSPAIQPCAGIRYLSLDNARFMRIQSFLSHIAFARVTQDKIDALLLHNEHLVSSSLSLRQTKILYAYLIQIVIPEAAINEVASLPDKSYWFKKRQVIFAPVRRFLSVFRSINGATMAIVHHESFDLDMVTPLCQDLYSLATQIAPSLNDSSNYLVPDHSINYVYMNNSNCALKTSSSSSTNSSVAAFEQDISLLTNTDFGSVDEVPSTSNDAEPKTKSVSTLQLMAKTDDDTWLTVQRAEQRTLYCSLPNHKNASLSEAALALPFSSVFQ